MTPTKFWGIRGIGIDKDDNVYIAMSGVKSTGWIDVLTGITAHQRADGEYLVFVEEDYRGKVILYRWKPD